MWDVVNDTFNRISAGRLYRHIKIVRRLFQNCQCFYTDQRIHVPCHCRRASQCNVRQGQKEVKVRLDAVCTTQPRPDHRMHVISPSSNIVIASLSLSLRARCVRAAPNARHAVLLTATIDLVVEIFQCNETIDRIRDARSSALNLGQSSFVLPICAEAPYIASRFWARE